MSTPDENDDVIIRAVVKALNGQLKKDNIKSIAKEIANQVNEERKGLTLYHPQNKILNRRIKKELKEFKAGTTIPAKDIAKKYGVCIRKIYYLMVKIKKE